MSRPYDVNHPPIKVNRVQCLECGEVLTSKYTHDFVMCGCRNGAYADGGREYLRRGGRSLDKIKELSELYSKEEWDEHLKWFNSEEQVNQRKRYQEERNEKIMMILANLGEKAYKDEEYDY